MPTRVEVATADSDDGDVQGRETTPDSSLDPCVQMYAGV